MRKKTLILILLLSLALLYSCMKGGGRLMIFDDSHIKADIRMKQILDCIQNNSEDELKAMFSRQALAEASDFDDSLANLFVFFQGNVENWERGGFTSSKITEYGKKSQMNISWYTVTTDADKYRVFVLDYTEDTFNPDNVGMYSLRLIRSVDEDTHFTYWQDMKIPGIYRYEIQAQ